MSHLTLKDFYALNDPFLSDEELAGKRAHLEGCPRCLSLFLGFSHEEAHDFQGVMDRPACQRQDDIYNLFYGETDPRDVLPLLMHIGQCEACQDYIDFLKFSDDAVDDMLTKLRAAFSYAAYAALIARGAAVLAPRFARSGAVAMAAGVPAKIRYEGELNNGKKYALEYYPDYAVFSCERFDDEEGKVPELTLTYNDRIIKKGRSAWTQATDSKLVLQYAGVNTIALIHIGGVDQLVSVLPYACAVSSGKQ